MNAIKKIILILLILVLCLPLFIVDVHASDSTDINVGTDTEQGFGYGVESFINYARSASIPVVEDEPQKYNHIGQSASGSEAVDDMEQTASLTGLNALTNSKTSLVGILISLIQYDNNKANSDERETTLGRVFFQSASTGAIPSNMTLFESADYQDIPDKYYVHGDSSWWGVADTSHYQPKKITEYNIDVTYGAASVSSLFVGDGVTFPQIIIDDFDFTLGGYSDSLRTTVFYRGDADGNHKGILGTYMPNADALKKLFQLPDLEIWRDFDTYFLRYEPVYRHFPALLKEDPNFEAGYDSGFFSTVERNGQNVDLVVPKGLKSEEDTATNFNFKEVQVWCDHIYNETWTPYDIYDPDDDGECEEGDTKSGTRCYHYYEERTDPRQCFYTRYTYSRIMHFGTVPTSIVTPRIYAAVGNYSLMSYFYNSYYDESTRKNAIDTDGNVLKDYDYIVGSTYKNAIASTVADATVKPHNPFNSTYNKYLLIGSISGHNFSNWKNEIVGMWLSSLMFDFNDCITTCKHIEDPTTVAHSSYDYLECAQSYCDSYADYVYSQDSTKHATNIKRECIVGKCLYKPQNPIDCDNKTAESNALIQKSVADRTAFADNPNSCCGFTSTNPYDLNGSKQKTKNASVGAYYDCKRYGEITKVNENGVSAYAYSTGNIDNSYINVVCEEDSNFDFVSLANKVIEPGTGFEYPIKLEGNKSCEVYFDTVSWIYDFASTHSLDRVRKRLLLQKVEAFNKINSSAGKDNQINGSDLLGNSVYKDNKGPLVSLEDVEGKLPSLSNFNYSDSLDKVSVTATTEEYVSRSRYTGGYSFYNGGGPIVYDRTSIHQTSNLYLNDSTTMTKYNEYQVGSNLEADKEITKTRGYISVNSYKIVSSTKATYELPKVCVDENNRGTVRLANSEGKCESFYSTKSGLRKYFTNFKYKNNDTYNNIIAKTTVAKTDMNGITISGQTYLRVDDTCHYSYEPSVSCSVIIEKYPACYSADSLVLEDKTSVPAVLVVDNVTTSNENIKSQVIYAVKDGSVIASGTRTINVPLYTLNTNSANYSESLSSANTINVYGEVTINDGISDKTYKCENSVIPIKVSDNANCTITSVGSDKYKVNIIGINNPSVYAGTGLQKDTADNISLVKIEPDTDGNYYFTRLKKYDSEVLMAKVEGSNGSAYCQLTFSCSIGTTCTSLYSSNEERDILEYCESNYASDSRRYNNSEECYEHCTMTPCEKDLTEAEKENLDKVEEYCTDNTTNDTEKGNCIATCYSNYDTFAKFRPINLNNPFPYSKYVGASYNAGNRKVGVEWVAAHNTITEDASQIQTGRKVEYKIHLTSSDIRAISADTKSYNDSLSDGSIYQYTTNGLNVADNSVCSSTGYTGFCSKFIYGPQFSSLFSYRKGVRNSG